VPIIFHDLTFLGSIPGPCPTAALPGSNWPDGQKFFAFQRRCFRLLVKSYTFCMLTVEVDGQKGIIIKAGNAGTLIF